MIDKKIMPSFEGWAMLIDGKLEDEMYGIGLINGVHYGYLDEILNSLKESIEVYLADIIDDLPFNCSVDFCATNISRNNGQMSFPETGQWDFKPYMEMDIEVINISIY